MSVRTLFMRNRPGKAAAVRVIHRDRKGTSGMGAVPFRSWKIVVAYPKFSCCGDCTIFSGQF